MTKQLPQSTQRFPIVMLRTGEPAHDNNADGYHVWVPGQVDIIVALEWLKGEPLGIQRVTAEEAIAHGEALILAGKRSQKMLEDRQLKASEAEAPKPEADHDQ